MKKTFFIISGILIFIVSIPIIFYLLFTIGTIHSSGASSINTPWVQQHKSTIKNDFSYIKNIKVYNQYGRVHFDCTVNGNVQLEDYKQVIQKTKEFIEKETIAKIYADEVSIIVNFISNKNIYEFDCPYRIVNKNNCKENVLNNYELWYLSINGQSQVEISFYR